MSDVPYAPSPRLHVAAHVDRYLSTDGEDGFEFEGAQCVILTTVGRKTGSLRRTPLIRVHDGEQYLLVASVGGRPRNPNWYLNLVDNPEVTVQDRGEVHRLRARTATPSEKAKLWPVAVRHWPEYDDYQARPKHRWPGCPPRRTSTSQRREITSRRRRHSFRATLLGFAAPG